MEQQSNQKKKQIQINLNDRVMNGQFSNISIINHDASTFVFDFAYLPPGMNKANVGSRIIMSSSEAKSFYLALKENIEKYEQKLGVIQEKNFLL